MKWKGADKASIRRTGSLFYRESGLGVMCPTQLLFPCAVGDYSKDGFWLRCKLSCFADAHTSPLSYKYNTPETRHLLWHVCVCFRVSTERCVFMSVSMSLFKMMEDRWYRFFLASLVLFFPIFFVCFFYNALQKKKEKEMVGYGPFINAPQYAASTELALGCGSCFHTELSNLFVLPGEELRDKEAKCKCKTSHDRIWQETEIFSIPLWCSLLHSLNHFNLPLNTIPSRLNFDHCHFENLQDWKDWDKCIIHPTHQFGSPLLSVIHFSHFPVSFVFCSLCSVEAS